MNKELTLFILFLSVCTPSFSQIPEFFREDLFFVMDDNELQISGDYYFYNPHPRPIKMTMLYPFPREDFMGKVSDVYAFDWNNIFENRLARYNQKAGMVQLSISPKETSVLRIGYTQELKAGTAMYILTTTAAWGKPFQQAYYELHVPFDIQVDSISYVPDKIQQVGGLYIYIFEKENFMPDRDFVIYFSE
jgi:hypothetical protein